MAPGSTRSVVTTAPPWPASSCRCRTITCPSFRNDTTVWRVRLSAAVAASVSEFSFRGGRRGTLAHFYAFDRDRGDAYRATPGLGRALVGRTLGLGQRQAEPDS